MFVNLALTQDAQDVGDKSLAVHVFPFSSMDLSFAYDG